MSGLFLSELSHVSVSRRDGEPLFRNPAKLLRIQFLPLPRLPYPPKKTAPDSRPAPL